MDALTGIGAKMQSSSGTGVMVNFEKLSDKPNGRPELDGGTGGLHDNKGLILHINIVNSINAQFSCS